MVIVSRPQKEKLGSLIILKTFYTFKNVNSRWYLLIFNVLIKNKILNLGYITSVHKACVEFIKEKRIPTGVVHLNDLTVE